MTTAPTDLASATTLVDRLRQQRQARLIETHISWVLLDGQDTWKLKKPLHLPFLDASTLARRHQLCEEELRLNHRMAPSLYLDVTPITGTADAPVLGGTGPAIEYAVHMRQFPEGALLGELLEAGEVQPTQLDDFARHLVDFHRSAEVAPPSSPYGSPELIAQTTRDVLREHIHIDGMPLHIIDTAGLRDATDQVEQIGIQRAWQEIEQADRVLFMVDGTTTEATDPHDIWPDFIDRLPEGLGVTVIRNKADITGEMLSPESTADSSQKVPVYRLSAKTGAGIDALREHLKQCIGFDASTEGSFLARRRHLDALDRAAEHLEIGQEQLHSFIAGEILAEELRLTQQHLNEITGEFSSDDLLGKIFSSFCIGK